MQRIFFVLLGSFFLFNATAQTATLIVYVSEDNNRGYLNEVKITLLDATSGQNIATGETNVDGVMEVQVPLEKMILAEFRKNVFEVKIDTLYTFGKVAGDKIFAKTKMKRKPGYLFEVTMAAKPGYNLITPAINKSDIEIYNFNNDSVVRVDKNYASPFFSVNFERGNHYIILVRAKDYQPKRMEAHVDIDGCILCFEGVGGVRPAVSDILTAGNSQGTLLANIYLNPVEKGFVDPYLGRTLAEVVQQEKLEKTDHWSSIKAAEQDSIAAIKIVASSPVAPALTKTEVTQDVVIQVPKISIPATPTPVMAKEAPPASVVETEASVEKLVLVSMDDINQKQEENVVAPQIDTVKMPEAAQNKSLVLTSNSIAAEAEDVNSVPVTASSLEKMQLLPETLPHPTNAAEETLEPNNSGATISANATKTKDPIEFIAFNPADFTGYRVQLLSTKGALSPNERNKLESFYPLIQEPRGVYRALLTGNFETREAAEDFRKSSAVTTFEGAYVVKYENGKRL